MHIVMVDPDPELASATKIAAAGEGFQTWIVDGVHDPAQARSGQVSRADVLVFGKPQDPEWIAALAALRTQLPDAARLLLLDPGEDAIVHSLHEGAHRVLRTPASAHDVVDSIACMFDLHGVLDQPGLHHHVSRVDHLLAPPRMYLRLLELMADDEVPLQRIVSALSQDPALVAQVLRMCNSAYYSMGRETTNIQMAVARLGLQTIRQLVLVSEVFGQSESVPDATRLELQDRAMRIAHLAGRIFPLESSDVAITAGLLAEVGKLLPEPDGAVEFDYAAAGAYLLGLWGLPRMIVEGVAFHRQPRLHSASFFGIPGTVHVATALACGEPVDEEYLTSVGVVEKLPYWRELAKLCG